MSQKQILANFLALFVVYVIVGVDLARGILNGAYFSGSIETAVFIALMLSIAAAMFAILHCSVAMSNTDNLA